MRELKVREWASSICEADQLLLFLQERPKSDVFLKVTGQISQEKVMISIWGVGGLAAARLK